MKIKNRTKYEFHVSKKTREKYEIEKELFSITGDLIIADFKTARKLTNQINEVRKKEGKSGNQVTSGLLNATGLIHEILHFLIRKYEEDENPGVLAKGLNTLYEKLGEKELNKVFLEFVKEFPPLEVYKGKTEPEDYLIGATENKSNKEIILEELILLHLQNNNPATVLLSELYSDKNISDLTKYIDLIDFTEQFFYEEKKFGPENLPLIQFLRKPIVANPYSVEAQLEYIRTNWGVYVYEKFNERLLGGQDLIREDIKLFLQMGGGEKATPPVPAYDRERIDLIKSKIQKGEELSEEEKQFYYSEPEKFTADIDWMPEVVMIAKNAFVWLDQLSKKYQREIKRLDQVPDEELDRLARWNFNALWLIGIWERSSASRKIKHLTGNPDAAASAYSLYDYVIANELGGEESFNNLKRRAQQRGIRMASDMVPNHTGVYSKWVTEKPDYFLQRKEPPYPSYTFNGPNLSDDERIEVRIEDKYYSREDAAVVFQRRDSWTGDIKYIYHGNDGTHMPWNDTAQLNLLNPEVKESLIQTIMHVARKTPIIRFDAAMTLAKKHYQRLWFPPHGSGGAIPSRSDYAMSYQEFNNAFGEEFWREVVDRINAEMPETLLLAEAFWLMEGYFVRSLGMHRVYNSAFMHMLMKEENIKYRDLIKNTLEFNPEILKRYVNFMSNPDEETAVNQFGKGDKYFGILLLMVTLPGLPMYAHGQIEGYSEKYGMEFKRAYYDEPVDEYLVSRHETEIFPLQKKRYLFSQVKNFELYDFIDNYGNVINDVFAFSNRTEGERGLIIFNNSYTEHSGTVKYSVKKVKSEGSHPETKTLGDALNIKNDSNHYYIFRDHKTNLQYIYSGSDLYSHGLYVHLRGYEYNIFIDFYEVYDTDGKYYKLNKYLAGKGVPSIEQAVNELSLAPVHSAIKDLFNKENVKELRTNYLFPAKTEKLENLKDELPDNFKNKLENVVQEINKVQNIPVDKNETEKNITLNLNAFKILTGTFQKEIRKKNATKWLKAASKDLKLPVKDKDVKTYESEVVFPLELLSVLTSRKDVNSLQKSLMADKLLFEVLDNLDHPAENINKAIELIKLLSQIDDNIYSKCIINQKSKTAAFKLIEELFKYDSVKNFTGLNVYEEITYYNKENFDSLLDWLFTIANQKTVINIFSKNQKKTLTEKRKNLLTGIKQNHLIIDTIKTASKNANYKFDNLKDLLNQKTVLKTKQKTKSGKINKGSTKPKSKTNTTKNNRGNK